MVRKNIDLKLSFSGNDEDKESEVDLLKKKIRLLAKRNKKLKNKYETCWAALIRNCDEKETLQKDNAAFEIKIKKMESMVDYFMESSGFWLQISRSQKEEINDLLGDYNQLAEGHNAKRNLISHILEKHSNLLDDHNALVEDYNYLVESTNGNSIVKKTKSSNNFLRVV